MEIYDALGNVRDVAWLHGKYGDVQVYADGAGPGWRAMALVEDADYGAGTAAPAVPWMPTPEATAALVAKALTEAGAPAEGVQVARYWPDAPALPPELATWKGRAVLGMTNVCGDVGFGMGPGDYYSPPQQAGASWMWVAQAGVISDAVEGLGMLAGTNHSHMNVVFRFEQGVEPPPPDEELVEVVKEIRDLVKEIRDMGREEF